MRVIKTTSNSATQSLAGEVPPSGVLGNLGTGDLVVVVVAAAVQTAGSTSPASRQRDRHGKAPKKG